MKIIDLAEHQYKNGIMPKHIKYNDEDLYFDGISYYDEEGNNDLLDILAMGNSALTHLYDELEIIEEDKEIEKGLKPFGEYWEEINIVGCDLKEAQEVYLDRLSKLVIELTEEVRELKKGK